MLEEHLVGEGFAILRPHSPSCQCVTREGMQTTCFSGLLFVTGIYVIQVGLIFNPSSVSVS